MLQSHDRGRVLVIAGAVTTWSVVALPLLIVAVSLATVGLFIGECDASCRTQGFVVAINLVGFVAVIAVAIALVARGRRTASWVGACIGAVVIISGLVALWVAFEQGRPDSMAIAYLLAAIVGGTVLATGCCVRLVDRPAR